jgi:restriction system protein
LRGPGGEQQRRALEEQRRAIEQQRRAATAQQQQRLRQQQYLREAQGVRGRAEAEQRAAEIRRQETQLESILSAGLRRSSRIALDALQRTPDQPAFDPGPLATPAREPAREDFAPGRLASLLGGRARKEQQEQDAQAAYERARRQWEQAEQERAERLAEAERGHERQLSGKREEAERYNSRVARVAAGLRERDPKAVESYLRTVLRRIPLPPDFPRRFEVTHEPAGERVTVRFILPGRDVIPTISRYEYAAPANQVNPVTRPDQETEEFYLLVIAQVALLTVRDVFEAEPGLAGVTFEGLVDRLEPATGDPDLACLVRLDVDRDSFARLDLGELSPEEGLRRLDASVSPDPYALQPITPLGARVSS